MKTILNSHELNYAKNNKAKGKQKNTVYANNIKEKQVNLKIDNKQYSIFSYRCKNLENKINDICIK